MSQPQGQPSSGSQRPESSSQQQQQQQRVRKPPFADWPTIKILTPPSGRFSPKVDEWCLTYCTQSVSGRIQGRESNCRSICIRKVFPHEVRNIVSFKRHSKVDADGNAAYPLPAEGQPINLPRLLGGKAPDLDDDYSSNAASTSKQKGNTPRNWEEGWYLWTSSSRKAALERMQLMSYDLEKQQAYRDQQEARKEIWHDFQDQLKQAGPGVDKEEIAKRYGGRLSSSILPPHVPAEERAKSLLIHIPPELPIREQIGRFLAPTYRALSILHDSVTSGEQKQFALRLWNKAKSNEPFVLAQRTLSRTYERWKDKDTADEDDSKKGST